MSNAKERGPATRIQNVRPLEFDVPKDVIAWAELYANQMTEDPDEIEELVQQVRKGFIKQIQKSAGQNYSDFSVHVNRTWVWEVVQNKLTDIWRAKQRRREIQITDESGISIDYLAIEDPWRAHWVSEDIREKRLDVMSELSADEYELICLRFYENQSITFIAERIGKNYLATAQRISRAKKRFVEIWERKGYGRV